MEELTKSKLHKILKKYRIKRERLDSEWKNICLKIMKGNNEDKFTLPSIYDHEKHNSKGHQLFKELMNELEKYYVFPPKK